MIFCVEFQLDSDLLKIWDLSHQVSNTRLPCNDPHLLASLSINYIHIYLWFSQVVLLYHQMSNQFLASTLYRISYHPTHSDFFQRAFKSELEVEHNTGNIEDKIRAKKVQKKKATKGESSILVLELIALFVFDQVPALNPSLFNCPTQTYVDMKRGINLNSRNTPAHVHSWIVI